LRGAKKVAKKRLTAEALALLIVILFQLLWICRNAGIQFQGYLFAAQIRYTISLKN
jgi:hypothetical protein